MSACVAVLLAVALLGACSKSKPKANQAQSGKPLVIGASISASGDFADPAKLVLRGYQLWVDQVNAKGGLLGRKVQLKIVDDASNPDQVLTNYQNLITRDHVDLVFGPFSSLLTIPAGRVASRYQYALLGPEGGGPKVFAEKLPNYFFVQPAPVIDSADVFVKYLMTLPADQRPKTAAYPSLDDPFAQPIVDRVRTQLESAGVTTVYKTTYPEETHDLGPIVQKMAAAKPDLVVAGTQSADAYAEVKAMVQQGFNPKMLYMTNGANAPTEFPDKVGKANVEGVFSGSSWVPDAKTTGNEEFVKAYTAKYGGTAYDIDGNSADAYAVGQLLEAVAAKAGKIDNQTIISQLHQGTWKTIQGDLSWDQYGAPQGNDILVEWVGGKLSPVFPAEVAITAAKPTKPAWGASS
jgi:branched-chain amino acid transport system substrate-binding protein